MFGFNRKVQVVCNRLNLIALCGFLILFSIQCAHRKSDDLSGISCPSNIIPKIGDYDLNNLFTKILANVNTTKFDAENANLAYSNTFLLENPSYLINSIHNFLEELNRNYSNIVSIGSNQNIYSLNDENVLNFEKQFKLTYDVKTDRIDTGYLDGYRTSFFEELKLMELIEDYIRSNKDMIISKYNPELYAKAEKVTVQSLENLRVQGSLAGKKLSLISLFHTMQNAKIKKIKKIKRDFDANKFDFKLSIADTEILNDILRTGNFRKYIKLSKKIQDIFEQDQVIIFMRRVEASSYLNFLEGFATKTLHIKAKSSERTGFIPVDQRLSKLGVKGSGRRLDVARFQKYSISAMDTILDDGLPASVAKKSSKNRLFGCELNKVTEIIVQDGDGWTSKYVPETSLDLKNEEDIVFNHADPRTIEGITLSHLSEWRKQKENYINKNADEILEKFVIFSGLLEEKQSEDDFNKLLQSSSLITADLDLLSFGYSDVKIENITYDVSNNQKGQNFLNDNHTFVYSKFDDIFYETIENPLLLGTTKFNLKRQLNHGFENMNTPFPQRLSGDSPLIYLFSNGLTSEIDGGNSLVNKKYIDKLLELNSLYGWEIPINPTEILFNFEDWKGVNFPYFHTNQMKKFLSAAESGNIHFLTKVKLPVEKKELMEFVRSKIPNLNL